MTLSSRHRIRNSSPGGLRPSTLPLGHGGSPQYWLSHVDGEKTFFVSFKPQRSGTEPRTLAWKAAVLTTTLGPPPCRGNMSQCRGKMSQCRGKMSVTGQDVTVPGQDVTVLGQDDYLWYPSKVSPLECRFLKHHMRVIKMVFYILNITSFNSIFCREDAEAFHISWKSDLFC